MTFSFSPNRPVHSRRHHPAASRSNGRLRAPWAASCTLSLAITFLAALSPLPAHSEQPPDSPLPLQRTTQVEAPRPLGVGRQTPDLHIKPLTGAATTTSKLLLERDGLVYVMTSTGCPLSRKYAARLAAIEEAFQDRVRFVYINTVAAESPDDMRRQVREFGFAGPYAPDLDRSIARALGARTKMPVHR